MSIHPYLFFSGDCRQAFEFYADVFSGELQLSTFGDAPEDQRMPGASLDQIMHVSLTFGDNVLMGSDDPTGDGGPKLGFMVTYVAPTATEAKRALDALAVEGELIMPFAATFWSQGFGMCTDKFGVSWMVDTAEASSG